MKINATTFSILLLACAMSWSNVIRADELHRLSYTVTNKMPAMRTLQENQVRFFDRHISNGGTPGQPALPQKVIRIALPPDADAASVKVEIRPIESAMLPGSFRVAPIPPKYLIHDGTPYYGPHPDRIRNGRDTHVYGLDTLFPTNWGSEEPFVGQLRQYRYKTVRLFPLRYNPTKNTLLYAEGFDITLKYRKRLKTNTTPVSTCDGENLARSLFFNYDQAKTWHGKPCSPLDDSAKNVAIIITEKLRNASSKLDDYVQMREMQGYHLSIHTENDWDISTHKTMDGRADRIRNWLQKNYIDKNLSYAFLIGNPDPSGQMLYSIPMKLCGIYEDSDMGTIRGPTDFYYADLSGTWDDNDNGIVCEFGVDNVDFMPEIFVGRIPIYSDGAKALDEILTRIIDYEAESKTGDLNWRRRMLLPNSIYFFEAQAGTNGARWDGASTGEYFIRSQLGPRGMDWTTLYEIDGLKPSIFESHFPVNSQNLVDQWVRGYGLVFWAGHGSNSGVYRTVWKEDPNEDGVVDYREMSSPEFMATDMLHMLKDAPPPFVIHGSCSNGTPEDPNNLGYSMLRRGAIATLSASRVALAWHLPDFGTEYWEKLESWDGCVVDIVTDWAVNILDGMEAGRALGTTIAKTTNLAESTSWFQKSIQNLYGDPLMRLQMCRSDADCADEFSCNGQEHCRDGSCMPGEAVDCEPRNNCGNMICVEGAGCVPHESCKDEIDAGSGSEGADRVSDSNPDADKESDGDPGGNAADEIGSLAGTSGCAAAGLFCRTHSTTLIKALLTLFE